ncbi:MAG TPA: alpha-L-rhamnosidase C-terminal domain-containing protein, partial [Anaerolineaceae bacterium]
LVGRAAGVLGLHEIEGQYLALARAVRLAFYEQYVTPASRIIGDSATAYALALQFALLPDEKQRQLAGKRLTTLLSANQYRISTGFVGTPLICDALCSVGEYDAAYRLLTQRGNPSWLYPVTMGATTIWERWDSLLPDGSVNLGEMTSFNHYALGAVADWLHRTVAGLAPAEPGYRKVMIQPIPGADLSHAAARFNSPYGLIESAWKIEDGQFHLQVTLPPNTTGTVTLPGQPGAAPIEIGSGTYQWSIPFHLKPLTRAPLSMDMRIGELIDYPEAFDRVMNIFRADNFELTSRLEHQTSLSLRQVAALMNNPDQVTPLVEETLERL